MGGEYSLTFHPDMESLLSDLRCGISPIPEDAVFTFAYGEIAARSGALISGFVDVDNDVFPIVSTPFVADL